MINQHGLCWSINPSHFWAQWDEAGILKQEQMGAAGGLKMLMSTNARHQYPLAVNNFLDGGFRVGAFAPLRESASSALFFSCW